MEGFVIRDNGLPEWMRTYFVDENGTVFLPCGAFGNELEAILCLGFDGDPFVKQDGHIYASAAWLAKHYPRDAGHIEGIIDRIRRRHRFGMHRTTGDRTAERETAVAQEQLKQHVTD